MSKSYVVAKARRHATKLFEPASEPQKRIFLKNYRATSRLGEARMDAGITWAQYKHALADDPDFLSEHEDIDSFLLDKLQGVAESLALKGDGAMIRWILEARWPEKYGKKAKVEHSHKFQSIEDIKALSDDDIMAECELLGVEYDS